MRNVSALRILPQGGVWMGGACTRRDDPGNTLPQEHDQNWGVSFPLPRLSGRLLRVWPVANLNGRRPHAHSVPAIFQNWKFQLPV